MPLITLHSQESVSKLVLQTPYDDDNDVNDRIKDFD